VPVLPYLIDTFYIPCFRLFFTVPFKIVVF
jgi:hypothetical protein